LAQAVKEGRHMLQEGNSLAEELDHMTKEEVTYFPRIHFCLQIFILYISEEILFEVK
jgi:hypothetical protein